MSDNKIEKAPAGPANLERRIWTVDLEVREVDDKPVISGYAAVFNEWSENLGGFIERIARGFFEPVINSDVRALWQHDPLYVMGRTTNDTLALAEDDTGLRVEIHPPGSQWANDALISLRRGDVTGMSFGFEVAEDRWQAATEDGPAERTLIRAAGLYDVSPVTFPAYPQTSVSVRQHLADLEAQAAGAGGNSSQGDALQERDDLQLRIKVRKRRV